MMMYLGVLFVLFVLIYPAWFSLEIPRSAVWCLTSIWRHSQSLLFLLLLFVFLGLELTSFPRGQALVRTECPRAFLNSSLFPPFARRWRRFFSNTVTTLSEFIEVSFTVLFGVGFLIDWVPLEFLIPRCVHTEPPAIFQFLRFPNHLYRL